MKKIDKLKQTKASLNVDVAPKNLFGKGMDTCLPEMVSPQDSKKELKRVRQIAAADSRRNISSTIERTDRFANIADGLVPWSYSAGLNSSSSSIDLRDAIELCQKAYYNFPIFRSTIDLMTEFSANNIYWRGGTDKSRKFFEALYNKLGMWSLQDKFFREYYRSGNVFIFRWDGKIKEADLAKLTQVYGCDVKQTKAKTVKLPARYTILNPSDIEAGSNVSFESNVYYKVLNTYEVAQLKAKNKTEEIQDIYDNLDAKTKKEIESGAKRVTLELDSEKVCAIFYKKQDYEPFAVPMGFAVLDDIEWKAELKKMDMAIARTMQQVVLLITMGYEGKDGSYNVNDNALQAMRALFENESVGRVLVADFTTKIQWAIPEIADILDPKKYEIVNNDIRIGLNNVLVGEEKFANQHIKTQIFVQRLEQARLAFLNDFLVPEIKRISEELGFKTYPTPYFENIDLRDPIQEGRIFAQLAQLGVLTAEETIQAIDSGKLPSPEESVESQKQFKEHKDNGLYEPLIGGKKDEGDGSNGRPPGTKKEQSTKKIAPVGTKTAKFSLSKVKDNLVLAYKLEDDAKEKLVSRFKVKELSEEQSNIAKEIVAVVIANESPKNWSKKLDSYIENPVDTDSNKIDEILEIQAEHQVDNFMAGVLLHSKIEEKNEK